MNAETDAAVRPVLGPLIRKIRKQQGLTLQDLADRAQISVGYLSQVERDLATPSLGSLAQIAGALGLGLDAFISTARPEDSLTRAATRPRFSLGDGAISYETLGASLPGGELSSYILHVPPGYRSEQVVHEGEEIIVVLDGAIWQRLGAQTFSLGPGDSLHYMGTTPHAWGNPGTKPARLLYTGTNALLRGPNQDPLPEISSDKAGIFSSQELQQGD